eukprot:1895358-Amphidinium_carterae.1
MSSHVWQPAAETHKLLAVWAQYATDSLLPLLRTPRNLPQGVQVARGEVRQPITDSSEHHMAIQNMGSRGGRV